MWSAILSPDFFSTILRSTTPILFATLASSIASKSGITNMALEGIMLFFRFVRSYLFLFNVKRMDGFDYHHGNRRSDWPDSGILRVKFKDR